MSRETVTWRASFAEARALDELAERWGVDRSAVIRRLLAEGVQRYAKETR